MLLTREEEAILFRQYNFARLQVCKLQDSISKKKNPRDEDLDELLKWFDIAMDASHLMDMLKSPGAFDEQLCDISVVVSG